MEGCGFEGFTYKEITLMLLMDNILSFEQVIALRIEFRDKLLTNTKNQTHEQN